MAKWTSGSHFITVVVILLADVRAETAQSGNGDCSVQQECQYKVNCSVGTTTTCHGWVNQTESDMLGWVKKTKCRGNNGPPNGGKPCLTVFFRNSLANSTARLESPWICATGHNASLLSFRYAITGKAEKKNCPLSVYLNTKTNSTSIWTSPGATTYAWTASPNLTIQSPECPFQLVFEGKRTDTETCGEMEPFNYLSISDILYEGVVPPSTTTSTTTVAAPSVVVSTEKSTAEPAMQPTTDVTTSSSKDTNGESLSGPQEDDTLGVGAVAGIGVGAVVIIACLIFVLIYVWIKRTRRDKTDSRLVAEGTENSDTLQTVVNPGYQPDNGHTTEDGNTTLDRSGKVKSGNFLYEVVATELPPIYSEPDDAITPTNTSKTKSAEANLQTKSSTEPESSELIYAKPVKPNGPGKDILEQQSAKSEETAEKPKGSEQNNYNKLVLQNPRAKRIDHTPLGLHAYDHLDGVVQSREDGSGLTATKSLSNASSLQGARPGYVNVDLPKPASQQPDQGVYNILDKERPSTPAVNPDVVGDTGLVYNRLNEVAPMNPAELDSAGQGSSSAGPKKRETEELYLNVDHDGDKPVPRSDSGGVHHQLDKDRPKERPSTPAANPDVAVDTGRVYNRLNEVTPVTAPITIKPHSAGHGSSTAGPKKRETDELYMNVDHDGVKPVPTSDSEGHQLNKDHPKERPTTPAVKKGVADTGLVYNRLNEVDPVTAPITTQPGRAGQGTSSAGPKRKGTKELYMNVDHDGVKPVPRSDSGGVYHQLEFDAKDRDQAATASGVYDHTA